MAASGVDVAALVRATVAMGFDEAVARAGLAAELEAWTDAAIAAVMADELGPGEGWRARAPGVVLVIAARTLPASTLRQVLAARMLGARVLVKSASGTEALGDALAAGDAAIVATPFRSSDTAALDLALAQSDVVVVLGSDEAVAAVAARLPAGCRLVAHGHRASAVWLAADADEADVAGLARDVAAWDQAGCLAPQVVWVEGDPAPLAERLAAALAALGPCGAPPAVLRAQQAAATLAVMAGGRVWRATAPGGGAAGVVATHPEAAFRGSPGHRFVWLLPADEAALRAFEPHLSTLAVGRGARPPTPLGAHVRVCAPGEMQRPPLAWRQDGLALFGSLLRA